ncbi:MAG: peptidoglycan-associated lipoprotein Pal [Pseudomonadota bacterium]
MLNRLLILFYVLFAFFIVGCSGNQTKPDDSEGSTIVDEDVTIDVGAPDELDEEGISSGLDDDGVLILDALDDPASNLFVRTIYFEYDSSDLSPESLEIVREHGQYLSENPDRLVRLEGHTDERGTRDYNLALGEERAKSVQEILVLEGATEEQIELVSFGEERPAVEGSDEEAYELNRRVEIVY